MTFPLIPLLGTSIGLTIGAFFLYLFARVCMHPNPPELHYIESCDQEHYPELDISPGVPEVLEPTPHKPESPRGAVPNRPGCHEIIKLMLDNPRKSRTFSQLLQDTGLNKSTISRAIGFLVSARVIHKGDKGYVLKGV